jgi:hypothetical protein
LIFFYTLLKVIFGIGFCSGSLWKGDYLEEIGVDLRIILKTDPKGIDWESIDRIAVAQVMNKWRGVVNIVLNIWVTKMWRIS